MKKLSVTTSWDDGQKIDMKLLDLMNKYELRGTFYATKSFRNNLSDEELLKIVKSKNEVGAHTLNHVNLTKVPISEAKEEIVGSKKYLEELLDLEITMFCYPFGYFNEKVKDIVKSAGFIGARSCNPEGMASPNDRFELNITLHASNSSPRLTFHIWKRNRLPARSLLDWELRAKHLFDLSLRTGGIYHIWGHGYEYQRRDEWDKLERVFQYISKNDNVKYLTNSESLRYEI